MQFAPCEIVSYRCLVVFLVTELLVAMPNHNMDNNKFPEVKVWFVQPELKLRLLCYTVITVTRYFYYHCYYRYYSNHCHYCYCYY